MGSEITLARPDTLKITVGAGESFYAIQRKLMAEAVSPTIFRARRELYVPFSELQTVRRALEPLGCRLHSSVTVAEAQRTDAARRACAAKRLIAEYDRDPSLIRDSLTIDEASFLDEHQKQAVAIASHPAVTGLCIFDEQGLGKTVSAIMAYHQLRRNGTVTQLLVLCPKNMLSEWQRDIERFLLDQYRLCIVTGDSYTKRRLLRSQADIFVTNYETALAQRYPLLEMLRRSNGQSLLVADETFYVKNSRALRTRAVQEVRASVGRCIVLCGTPAPNSAHDLIAQFDLADCGGSFRNVVVPKDREAAMPIIREAIENRGAYVRRLKEDVLPQLPSKRFQKVIVPLEGQQRVLYADTLESYLRDLEASTEASFNRQRSSFIAQRSALLQICSNPKRLFPTYSETPAKLTALDSILTELVHNRGEKVIIWSFYTASLEAILQRYAQLNPIRIDGAVSNVAARRSAIDRFQNDNESWILVANPAAASAGLTLHRARFAIYESLSNQAAHYLQSLDRIHRRGQTRDVEYLLLLCDQTIEEREYAALQKKDRASRVLLGDPVSTAETRTTLLQEARAAARVLGI
jgi:SNF2 family DNA or RNA helicase